MDFTILPYGRLPELIRENESLRQTLLQSGGIMKYVAEHIDDPIDDDAPFLFPQYQNYIAKNYQRDCRLNPNRQSWSVEDMRQRALNGRNHLYPELQSRIVLMRTLRMLTDLPIEASIVVGDINWKYLEYAWKEDLKRRLPDIDTDLRTYRYVMQQFERFGRPLMANGLACCSINNALRTHHGYKLTETENFDSFEIEMFHHYFFGPTIISRLERGLAESLKGKDSKECRAEAMDMLQRVKWFSQHIYNDDVNEVLNDSFTLGDKRWLRSLVEHYSSDFRGDELSFFYFAALLADIGRLWEKQLRSYPDLDLSELEKKANSLVNTKPSYITWEEEKQCFKSAVLNVMKTKRRQGGLLFNKPTHWIAVYRYAVDIEIMYEENDPCIPKDPATPRYSLFAKLAHDLQLDEPSITRLPFSIKAIDSMGKEIYARYRTRRPWSKDGLKGKGLKLYEELDAIYYALSKSFLNLLEQAQKCD